MKKFIISDELRNRFLLRRHNEISELQTALAKQDWNGIRLTGHSLKGSGALYGYEEFSECGARLEAAAIAQNVGLCQDEINQLSDLLQKLNPDAITLQQL